MLKIKTMEISMGNKNMYRREERGNVLFLILIAVALFAALSYAVTQSTRSGGGSSEREKSILSGATMTQHPTALRTSIIRMVLSGTDVANLKFNSPANFGALSDTAEGVFHPEGGGGLFQNAPADVMSGSTQGIWFYNANWDLPQIGISDTGSGNDLIAFLPGVGQGVCRAVNKELVFVADIADCTSADGVIPDIDAALTVGNIREDMDNTYTFPTSNQEDLENSNGACTAFIGHPSGCFWDAATNGGEYVFYSVLLER